MPFPDTDYPVALDATEDRIDYVDVVYADDFNYHDGQIRKVQEYLGITSELIGQRIAGTGPGGMVSPVASGAAARAFRLAARNAFSAGYLLSVGDAWDTSYTEKLQLSYAGLLWTLAGIDASAKLKIPRSALPPAGEEGRLHWDPAGPSLKYDDGAVWNDVGGGGGASEEQIFSIAMLMGQEPPIVPDSTDLDKQTYRIVVGNAAAGDTAEGCDYLDIGDGAQLQAALTAAGSSQSDVFVRSGTYNLGLTGSPATCLVVPAGVRVVGAGRNQVTIVTRDGGDGAAFSLGNHVVLEELRIYCTAPTVALDGTRYGIVESFDPDGCSLRFIDIVYPDWSGVDPGDLGILWTTVEFDGPVPGTPTGAIEIIDCTIQNAPSDSSVVWMTGFYLQDFDHVTMRNLRVTGSATPVDTYQCKYVLLNQFDFRGFDRQGVSIVGLLSDQASASISDGFVETDHLNEDYMILWSRMTGGSIRSVTLSTLGVTLLYGLRIAYGGGHSIVGLNSLDGVYSSDFVCILGSSKNIICACNMESNTYIDSVDTPPTILGDSEIVHCFSGGRSWP